MKNVCQKYKILGNMLKNISYIITDTKVYKRFVRYGSIISFFFIYTKLDNASFVFSRVIYAFLRESEII
jgi:hypothetical protein